MRGDICGYFRWIFEKSCGIIIMYVIPELLRRENDLKSMKMKVQIRYDKN